MPPVYDYAWLNRSLALAIAWMMIGLIGLLTRRNWLVMALSAGLLGQGASLAILSLETFSGQDGGRFWSGLLLGIGGLQAAVLGALALRAGHQEQSLDPSRWQNLRDPLLPPEGETAAATAVSETPTTRVPASSGTGPAHG